MLMSSRSVNVAGGAFVAAILLVGSGWAYLRYAPRRTPAGQPALRVLAEGDVGSFAAAFATQLRGASNAKAKRELDWQPRYPSWRTGFREALG